MQAAKIGNQNVGNMNGDDWTKLNDDDWTSDGETCKLRSSTVLNNASDWVLKICSPCKATMYPGIMEL